MLTPFLYGGSAVGLSIVRVPFCIFCSHVGVEWTWPPRKSHSNEYPTVGTMYVTSSCRKWPHADCSDGEADARAAEDGRTLRKNRLPVGGRNGTDSTRAPPGACSSPSVGACGRRARTAVPLGAYSHREGLSVPRSSPRLFDVQVLRPDTALCQSRRRAFRWLAALMRARVCGGGSRAPESRHTRHARWGTCRNTPAWPLGALARPGGAACVVHRHPPMHDRGPGWRRSCGRGCAGAAVAPFG